ncbi:MAG: CvpA family protein [Desulfovibrionaceae bacterium]
MNTVDIIILSILILFGFRGLFHGLLREALSFGALLLGIFAAMHGSHYIAPHLAVHIQNPETVKAVSALVTFLVTVGLTWTAARLLSGALSFTPAVVLDKGLGAAFGLIEGYLICILGVLLLETMAPDSTLLQNSTLAPLLEPGKQVVNRLLPDSLKQLIASMPR